MIFRTVHLTLIYRRGGGVVERFPLHLSRDALPQQRKSAFGQSREEHMANAVECAGEGEDEDEVCVRRGERMVAPYKCIT